MILSKIELKGYRNFKDAIINFNKKTLIIGGNDVGKTNLFWAIRLLMDRSLSDYDLDPRDSDFYAFEETNEFSITLNFEGVTDDCVRSKLRERISDEGNLFLRYQAFRDKDTKAKSYKMLAGATIETLEEIEDRFYRKVLNVRYISSRRDLHHYINREKNFLFECAKESREEAEKSADDTLYTEIQKDLATVDGKIPQLNFIAKATDTINAELEKLSLHHKKQKVVFDAATSNVDNFISSVSIASKHNEQSVEIGGDGRLNQIYLALWASRNHLTEESLTEVTIFCIEEPEAHLHPHQQRKLADYINQSLRGQVLLSSHSPQIASEFKPNSIVRLQNNQGATTAASNGCSEIIDAAFVDFGYRMSIIPAEAFFADVVFLVEGPSEEMFYKTLAKQIGIDLDRLNISILMVDGIGFKTFINILKSLGIGWVLRTDFDIFKVPHKEELRFAGLQRCISYYRELFTADAATQALLAQHEENLQWPTGQEPPKANLDSALAIRNHFESLGMFLANKDLENDIFDGPINDEVKTHFGGNREEAISIMQTSKAVNMYDFLKKQKESLVKLKADAIANPLYACVKYIEALQNEAN